MSDLLSQDEIDALLNGVGADSGDTKDAPPAAEDNNSSNNEAKEQESNEKIVLNEMEKDALGEIGNISMGAAATALNTIVGQMVDITTPKVSILTWEELITEYQKPYVVTKVEYTQGLTGTNLLIMKTNDVKILTNLMMGEDANTEREMTELELSAMSEAMNQMVGSSSTSLATMMGMKIDIAPPKANFVDFATEDTGDYQKLYGDKEIVKVAFRIVVGDLIDSEIMQLLPLAFAKKMVEPMLNNESDTVKSIKQPEFQTPEITEADVTTSQNSHASSQNTQQINSNGNAGSNVNLGQNNIPNGSMTSSNTMPSEPVNVQPVQFQSLDESHYSNYKENIGLIMDVPLQVTVELGRTTKMIREILEFGPGSIVELDKLAGEPVDILVNGKIIAKGEVVVIDESFGVRITDIVHPSKRI